MMHEHQSSLAVLLVDVAGSTPLVDKARKLLGPEFGERILKTVEKVFKEVSAEFGGTHFLSISDEHRAYFPTAALAADACCELLKRLRDYSARELAPHQIPSIRLHCSIHSGEIHFTESGGQRNEIAPDDPTVTLAKRLLDTARPDQVLLSDSANSGIVAPLHTRYIGRYRLQGIGWHRVYALRGSNLRLETRPPLPLNPIGTPLISRTALALFVFTAACLTIAQNSWRWQVPESASISSAGILQTFNKKGNSLLRLPIENIYYEVFRRKGVAHPPPFRLIPSFYPAQEPGKDSRVIDLTGDGRKEIVVSVVGARGENQATSIIAALSHTGNLLWWWMPDRKVITGSRSFPDSLSTEFVDISDLDGDGDPEILLTAYNYPDWAEGLYVLSHKGAPLCEWWNSGAIVPVPADLDEDGIKEIIVAGVNNEPGTSPYGDAIVAILKWKTFRIGSSPQKTEDYKIKAIPEGGHSLYIHLPPADTGLLFQHFDFARVSAVTENEVTIEMNTLVGPRHTDLAQIYFTFDHSFRLQRITPAENYKPVHTALYRAGKLKRSWQAMVAEMTKMLHAPPHP